MDAVQQAAILAELTRPAHRKLLECACGHYQFVLTAEIRKRFAGEKHAEPK